MCIDFRYLLQFLSNLVKGSVKLRATDTVVLTIDLSIVLLGFISMSKTHLPVLFFNNILSVLVDYIYNHHQRLI